MFGFCDKEIKYILKNINCFKVHKINKIMARTLTLTAYEIDKGKYIVGVAHGFKERNYIFREGCVVDGKTLIGLKEEAFKAELKRLYTNEKDKGDRKIALGRVVNPTQHTIDLVVE